MIEATTMVKERILQALNNPLPGLAAQLLMAMPGRYINVQVPSDARKAAVLVLLYNKSNRIFLALIRRKIIETDRHSGQISFPGGKVEPGDDFPVQTALREAEEEIGINHTLEILGLLTPLYIPVSNFHVTPVVAWYGGEVDFIIQENEVEELIELELALLIHPEVKSLRDMKVFPSMVLKGVPVYDIQGLIIWGATAMMLSELEVMIKASSR
ncbi:MAG: CoA pyrophosphatase [Saprospiraceae bacterium]|nr:CoA pyrophosphatase [Saprospiraceae bacterium]